MMRGEEHKQIEANGSLIPAPRQDLVLNGTPAYEVPWGEPPDESGQTFDLGRYWLALKRGKWWMLLLAVVSGAIGLLVDSLAVPAFIARATIEATAGGEIRFEGPDKEGSAGPSLEAQARWMVGSQQRMKVAGELLAGSSGELGVRPRPLAALLDAWGVSIPGLSWKPTAREAVRMAAQTFRVRQQGPQSRLLELSASSPDPEVARRFVEVMIHSLVERNLESRITAGEQTNRWLTKQVGELKAALERSESELQSYARSSGLVQVGEQGTLAEERLRGLQQELSQAEAQRMTKQSKHDLADAVAADKHPDVLNDPVLRQYENELNALRKEMAQLSATYTPAHYKVKRVEAQVAELVEVLKIEKAKVMARVRSEHDEAARREKILSAAYTAQTARVSDLAQKRIHYDILKREVEANRQLYETMLQRVKTHGISSALSASSVQIVDPPEGGREATPLMPFQNTVLGLVAGVLLATVFLVVRDARDRSVRAPGEGPVYLRVNELGVIPHAGLERAGEIGSTSSAAQNILLPWYSIRGDEPPAPVELMTWRRHPSLFAESFRSTVTSLLFTADGTKPPETIVLTSGGPSEGKSAVTSNLAIAMADMGHRVLIIDADLRRPRQHSVFDISNSWGLSDLLEGGQDLRTCPLEALVRHTEIPNISLLPSGPATNRAFRILYSARMEELLQRLRGEYSRILIDTPPVLQFSDARMLARFADGVLLVVRAGQSHRDEAAAAVRRIRDDGARVLGMVLNGWNPQVAGRSYYHSRYKYYREDGSTAERS